MQKVYAQKAKATNKHRISHAPHAECLGFLNRGGVTISTSLNSSHYNRGPILLAALLKAYPTVELQTL